MLSVLRKVRSLLRKKTDLPIMSTTEQQLAMLLAEQEAARAKKLQMELESKCLDQMVQTASSMRDAGLTHGALHKLEQDTLLKNQRANALISRLLADAQVDKAELEEFGVK